MKLYKSNVRNRLTDDYLELSESANSILNKMDMLDNLFLCCLGDSVVKYQISICLLQGSFPGEATVGTYLLN